MPFQNFIFAMLECSLKLKDKNFYGTDNKYYINDSSSGVSDERRDCSQ